MPEKGEALTHESLLHRLRRVGTTLSVTIAAIELYMFDEDLEEVSISQLLDLEEIQWYENPHKVVNHLVRERFLEVSRKEYTKEFPRGYRHFRMTARGEQIASDFRLLIQESITAQARRTMETEA